MPRDLEPTSVAGIDGRWVRARLVGGCVRDALLGLPVSDIDVATPLVPDEVVERLVAAGIAAKYAELVPFLQARPGGSDGTAPHAAALEYGYRFMEKFVQISFHLPRPDPETLQRYVASLTPPHDSADRRTRVGRISFPF